LVLAANARAKLTRCREFHHTDPFLVPRLGGVALALAFLAIETFITAFFPHERARIPGRGVVIASSLAMFALGFWDDLKPLGAKRKLIGQVMIAGWVFVSGIGIQTLKVPFTNQVVSLGGWGALLTIAWLVGITNLVNLIDGVDGLAGGICLMLMGLLVYVGHANGTFVLLTAGMTGALLGFLWFNFPPARIYLGDGGAYFLGFQIGLFSLVSSHKGTILGALVAPLFVLALPIVDTTLAILRRGLRGLPVFRPDRSHIHHHLLGAGMSSRKVVLSLYGLTLVFLVLGFAAFCSRGEFVPLLLGIGALVLLICAGKLDFSREWFAVGRTLGNSLAMRRQIQYALCLTRWLACEGDRCRTLQELFQDLVFAARRLGFTSVKLRLADRQEVWSHPQVCAPPLRASHSLDEGACGVLELETPTCRLKQTGRPGPPPQCATPCCPPITDSRLFEITAELLAEGWMQAASKWKTNGTPLRFDLASSIPNHVQRPDPQNHKTVLAKDNNRQQLPLAGRRQLL
jgi:UDP-GlcNAc:undecaprenyl-phosphate GlcNAc-1-phosphate transferase